MPANVPPKPRRRRFALPARRDPAEAHERLRFWALVAIALLKLGNLFGGIWDIQWHVTIGRDSLWIPPHLLVLAAFVSGLGLVIGVPVHETRLARAGVHLEGNHPPGADPRPAGLLRHLPGLCRRVALGRHR